MKQNNFYKINLSLLDKIYTFKIENKQMKIRLEQKEALMLIKLLQTIEFKDASKEITKKLLLSKLNEEYSYYQNKIKW